VSPSVGCVCDVSIRQIIRFDNWWFAKIPPLLAAAYLSILLGGLDLGRAVPLLGCFVLSIACVASYGHVVNDLFDVEADTLAGKPNAVVDLGPRRAVLVAFALVLAGWLTATLGDYPRVAGLLLVLNYAWPTLYSVPGVRLKERGVLGVVCDALGSHVTPTLFAVTLFVPPITSVMSDVTTVAALLVVWSLAQGTKGILNHQLADLANDEVAGVVTFATSVSAGRLERFLPRFNLCVEWPVSLLLVVSVARVCPLAVIAFVLYCLVELIKFRLGFEFALTAGRRRPSFPFVNELFYVSWLPLAAGLQLVWLNPSLVWLPIVHILLFLRVFRLQAGDLRATAAALQRRFIRYANMPPAA
jgi:4-hydroxybenzoate polyprenyltransferase